jgi:hypothetical protein
MNMKIDIDINMDTDMIMDIDTGTNKDPVMGRKWTLKDSDA